MVRCSVKYDEELKEQVFFVRGDEDYARSTSTVLRVGEINTDTYDFSVTIYVNVFRDKGGGSIVIYDNDEVVNVIDLAESSNDEVSITFEHMDYDTEHIFKAKYSGSKQCSPSVSNTETVYVEDTRRVASSLAFDGSRQFNPNTLFSKNITLSAPDVPISYLAHQEIIIYLDDVRYTTVETNNQGIIEDPPSFNLSQGLHTLRAEYNGSEHLTSSNTTQTISIGYNIQATSYPSIVVAYNNYSYSARVTDFLGNPVTNVAVNLYSTPPSQSPAIIGTATTDANGYATFSNEVSIFKFKTSVDSVDYETDIITLTYIYINDITVSSASANLYKGETNSIVVDIQRTDANVPITVTGAVNTTIYTNSNGIATLNIIGDGTSAKKSLSFKVNRTLSKSLQFDDYTQYWAVNDIHNRDYDKQFCDVLDLASYFRVDKLSGSQGFYILFPIDNSKNYEIILSNVNASANANLFGAYKDSSGQVTLGQYTSPSRLNNATITITNSQVKVQNGGSEYISQIPDGLNKTYIGFALTNISQITFTKLTMQEIV